MSYASDAAARIVAAVNNGPKSRKWQILEQALLVEFDAAMVRLPGLTIPEQVKQMRLYLGAMRLIIQDAGIAFPIERANEIFVRRFRAAGERLIMQEQGEAFAWQADLERAGLTPEEAIEQATDLLHDEMDGAASAPSN